MQVLRLASLAQDDTLFWVVTLPILAMELRRMGDGAFFATQAGDCGGAS